MTDILVTFEDGTTELRAANSPALFDEGPQAKSRWPSWTPADVCDGEAFPPDWGSLAYLFKFSGGEAYASRLSLFQSWVTGAGKRCTPLVWAERWGWRPCKVESVDEQIERVTRERDAEKARATAGEKRFRAFVREIATGYDHDEDAHRHRNGACRVCNAEKLAAELGFEIEEDAR